MKEQIMKILSEIRPDLDFATETKLIDGGFLDSFDIIAIVSELNESFDVDINVEDLEPVNFNSAGAMVELVQRLKK